MSMKDAYQQKLQSQLDEWHAEIDQLKAKANAAEADTKIEYEKEIEELEAMQATANEKLDHLKNASDDAWEDLKAGMDNAWSSIERSLNSARSRFK